MKFYGQDFDLETGKKINEPKEFPEFGIWFGQPPHGDKCEDWEIQLGVITQYFLGENILTLCDNDDGSPYFYKLEKQEIESLHGLFGQWVAEFGFSPEGHRFIQESRDGHVMTHVRLEDAKYWEAYIRENPEPEE